MWYSNLEKNIYFSTYPPTHWYTCPIALSVHRNPHWPLSQPLPRLVGHHLGLSDVLEKMSPPSCERIYTTDTPHRERETFIYDYPFYWALLPTKNAQQNAAFRSYTSQARSPFWLLKTASEHKPGCLLPSHTHRKLITSITAVLLPFVTYLQTLPRIILPPMSRSS
jgi:hypothetical protein